MVTITKKRLTTVIFVEVVFILCKCIGNYYTQEIVYHGNYGILDWLYMYLVFPLQYISGAGLLSSPVHLIVEATNNGKQQLRNRIVSIAIMSMLSLIIYHLVFMPYDNTMISVFIVLGVVISGMAIIKESKKRK